MAKNNNDYIAVPLQARNASHGAISQDASAQNPMIQPNTLPDSLKLIYPFDNDSEFWEEVEKIYKSEKPDISYYEAIDKARVHRIERSCKENNVDPAYYLMETIYEDFSSYHKDTQNQQNKINRFKEEISRLMIILLDKEDSRANEEETDPRYSRVPRGHDLSLLHVAAKNNLIDIAKDLLRRYNGLQNVTTRYDAGSLLPLEYSLKGPWDEMSSMLIQSMERKRLLGLLEDETINLRKLSEEASLKKTIITILDCLVEAEWFNQEMPFKCQEQRQESSHEPLRFVVHHRPLCDVAAPDSKVCGQRSSAFHKLIMSSHSQNCVEHRAIRLLVNKKWNDFARSSLRNHLIMYLLFLSILFSALFLGAAQSPTSLLTYEIGADYVRLSCEILVLLFTICYFALELDQLASEGCFYIKDKFNWLDFFGIAGVLVMIPLRIANLKAQWNIACLTFILNVLRVFKFCYIHESTGTYFNTLWGTIAKDLWPFLGIYAILGFAFTGGLYFALTASSNVNEAGGFKGILVKEIRALFETNSFSDNYDEYNAFVTTIILLSMFTIILLMSNILIAQLSYRYEEAVENARIQFDINKALMVMHTEDSRIINLANKMFKRLCFCLRRNVQHPGSNSGYLTAEDPKMFDMFLSHWKKEQIRKKEMNDVRKVDQEGNPDFDVQATTKDA